VTEAEGLVIDTSAAVAVLLGEPDAESLAGLIDRAEIRLMSTATFVELSVVLEGRFGSAGTSLAPRFLDDGGVELVPFDADQATVAMAGWRRFGKGRHPAALNLGDCFSYALAIASGLPILCTGHDFIQTDAPVIQVQ
jgi:ribonuclease VapC